MKVCCLLVIDSIHRTLTKTATAITLAVWRSNRTLVSINEVTLRRARLVLGWVTGPGFNSRCRKPISVHISHPGQLSLANPPWVCANEYQPKGGDALQLGSKGRHGLFVGGR